MAIHIYMNNNIRSCKYFFMRHDFEAKNLLYAFSSGLFENH